MSDRPRRSRGSIAFDAFCTERSISNWDAAYGLGCSDVAVLEWRRGSKTPNAENRIRIEEYTRESAQASGILPQWWDEVVGGGGGAGGRKRPPVKPYRLAARGGVQ